MCTRWPPFLLAAAFAPALLATAWAQTPPTCRLHPTYRGTVYNLGALDPSRPGEVVLSRGGMHMQGPCAQGSQVSILGGAPLALTGPGGAQLPYQASLRLEPGRGNTTQLVLSISVPSGSYADLPAGEYDGHFTVSVTP